MSSESPVAYGESTPGAAANGRRFIVAPSSVNGDKADRGRDGRFRAGNTAALVHGARSAQFWVAAAAELKDRSRALIHDAGCRDLDEPCTCRSQSCTCAPIASEPLRLSADAMARASLTEQGTWLRMLELGGPTTLRGRTRAVFSQWAAAGGQLSRAFADYRQARALPRVARRVPSLAEYLSQRDREMPEPSATSDDE